MLDTPEAVVEALRENHDRPHGLPRTITAEELVEAAEQFEKPDVLVTALLELMTAYEFTGEHRKSPVVFARLLKLWDTAAESFSEWEAHQVFWRFKWVTTSLLQVPEVPLATVDGWIDRMRERYEAAEHGMQPVAAMRYHVAAHTGTGVVEAHELWATRPRTELSDCEACETRHLAVHRATSGDDAGALEEWRPVLEGAMSCTEEPQMSQARALLPLLRTGRTDEARSHHLTGYRRVRGNTGMQDEVGLHLEFCALSRNEGRGLEILAENRPLFETTGAPLARLGFLTGAEVLLARLVEDGHADTAVAGPPGRNWTAGELLAHVRSEADPLSAAFDARNGTSAVGDERRSRLARRPLLDEPLPLGLRTSVTRAAAGVPAALPAPAAGPAVPEDFVALVREARRMANEGHPGDTRLWTRIAERLADGSATHDDRLGPEDLLRAELAEQRAFQLSQKGRDAESITELTQAAELFGRLGMPWHALSARSRAVAWSTRPGDGDADGASAGNADDDASLDPDAIRADVDEVLREAERLKAEAPLTGENPGEGEAAAGVDVAVERVLAHLGVLYSCTFAAYQELLRQEPEPADSAVAWFEASARTLHTEAERLSVPHQVANARQFVADVAGRRGDLALAESQLRAALKDIEASERPWRGSRPRALLAQILIPNQGHAEATELLHRAIADAVRYDDADFPMAPTYALLGHAASHLGDFAGAVRHLSEGAARYDQEEAHNEAADLRLQLADVLARTGQQADAVAVLESVLSDEAAGSLHERLAAQARLTLARGLRELEEYLASAEEFLRLADTVAAWEEDREIHTLVAVESATTLAMADRWDAAGTAYERALAAHAEAPNPGLITQMMCEFARLTMLSRGPDGLETALDHLKQADAVRAAVPEGTEDFVPWYESGSVHYRRARVLAEAERFPEALAEAEAAIAAHEQGGEQGEMPRAEAVRIAALIEGNGLGRFKEAIARLTTAAARCRKADLSEAAQILDALRQDYMAR
ncbi:hypothetical protein [Streptomyces solicathayae]|uniref:Tetratricopeptide repeat protein n=1 Tax=Streptomyces solicathayae TaxID=3081768 RepID=A0ABZ0LKP5_9ACTN|nr:hypothetical protein [Streptomyces sp. HUAS YS2]WOX20097.1 hypothetical protein R2D22_01290 [Streptomyces sp. HUAS YS2]